jgi:hypothetical protein
MLKEKGQSLVEMAIIMPILLIMFLGVLEVGFAIRSYMIILDASREGARYASKTYSMDLRNAETAKFSYTNIISHTSLNLDRLPDDEITDIIITNIQIFGEETITKSGRYTVTNPINMTWYGTDNWRNSQLELEEITNELVSENRALNEVIRETGGSQEYQREQGCIIVEIIVKHHQLIKFPAFTWADPTPFHVFTMMRRNKGRD